MNKKEAHIASKCKSGNHSDCLELICECDCHFQLAIGNSDQKCFVVTFGVKYMYDKHPAGSWVDPGGVMLVIANSESNAREMVFSLFGKKWSMMRSFSSDSINPIYYPRGVIAVLTKDGLLLQEDRDCGVSEVNKLESNTTNE